MPAPPSLSPRPPRPGYAPPRALEDQLAALTREFVARLVDTLRNASLADVAALSTASPAQPGRSSNAARPREPREAHEEAVRVEDAEEAAHVGRQTAARRAEIGDRLRRALASARQPLGVRALASALGLDPGVLAVPLRELRAAGKIRKHGEKRATTYSLA